MLIDSIIIKLVRDGLESGPCYSLTIHGDGKIVYEGFKSVKIKGKVEEVLGKDKIISILSDLKNSGFFSIGSNDYKVDETAVFPYTTITISTPGENNITQSKSVTHYDDDPSVPMDLKRFENKIDEIVGSEKWVKRAIDIKKKSKPLETKASTVNFEDNTKPDKRKSIKAVVGVVCVVVALILILFSWQAGLFTPSKENLPPEIEYIPPTITYINTSIDGTYLNAFSTFEQGYPVYLYFEFENVTHAGKYDIKLGIIVLDFISGKEYYNVSYDQQKNTSNVTILKDSYSFETNDSWPIGPYNVFLTIEDKISKKSNHAEINFTLLEKTPKIIVLESASNVTKYKVYIAEYSFNHSTDNRFFIYTEYKDIATVNDEFCNISLYLEFIYNGTVVHSYNESKNVVGNNSHVWEFVLDNSWSSGLYLVKLTLFDNITKKMAISRYAVFTIF